MDLISRKAAIEVIDAVFPVDPMKTEYAQGIACGAALAKTYVEQLPSSQPEIIRCKECKHWMPYDWMFSEVWRSKDIDDYSEDEIGCAYCDMNMGANDFCSRGERRTDENNNE